MRKNKLSYKAFPWWEIQNRPMKKIKREKVLVKEIYENSILVTGLIPPYGCKVHSLYYQPDTNSPKINIITDCLITPERQILFLEKSTIDFPIHKHVTVQFYYGD